MKKLFILVLFDFFFQITFKVLQFCEFQWLYQKNHIKIDQAISSFYSNKDFKLIKKWKIQVIITKIMLTGFSERIYNPMRYTGYIYDYKILPRRIIGRSVCRLQTDCPQHRIKKKKKRLKNRIMNILPRIISPWWKKSW